MRERQSSGAIYRTSPVSKFGAERLSYRERTERRRLPLPRGLALAVRGHDQVGVTITSAKALLIAGIATIPLLFGVASPIVGALGVPDAGGVPGAPPVPTPAPDEAPCDAQAVAPRLVWTPCQTRTDFSAGNLTVEGRAQIGQSLLADSVITRALDVSGPVSATSVTLAGALAAKSATFREGVQASNLQVDGRTEVGLVQLRITNAPACQEGVLALVRNADGSDTLEVCLRTAQGNFVWTPIAMGGYVPKLTSSP